MKRLIYIIMIGGALLLLQRAPVFARGDLTKAKNIAASEDEKNKVLAKEDAAYSKALTFINSPGISKGMTQDAVIQRCGEPLARVRDGAEWVYKPSSSTFFEGEKIYFRFDRDGKLDSWEKVSQQ